MTLTLQQPIGSGYGASTTASEILHSTNLSGVTAIVTGGYSGIGTETVRALASAGAAVIVPARDIARAGAALAGINNVSIERMDLMNPDSIDDFAARFLASARPLHMLINSAGIMAAPLVHDARGYESHFSTNHLGHFQLTARLWPALRQAGGARVISVSSWGHRQSPVVFGDPNFKHRSYDRMSAYGQSKTANILFALALDKRGKDEGVRAFSVHPGSIAGTGLEEHFSVEELQAAGVIDGEGNPILDPSRNLKTAEQGAATSVWCAVSPQLDGMGGVYCENCDIAPLVENAEAVNRNEAARRMGSMAQGVMPHAVDPEAADQLWILSEQMTNVKFAVGVE